MQTCGNLFQTYTRNELQYCNFFNSLTDFIVKKEIWCFFCASIFMLNFNRRGLLAVTMNRKELKKDKKTLNTQKSVDKRAFLLYSRVGKNAADNVVAMLSI